MKLKAIAVAPLLPSPGGGAISRSELLSGIARTRFEVCVIAPITSEALRDGDWFAARHPELRIVRYRLPEFLFDGQGPMNSAHSQFERDQICRLANDLIPTMQPDVLIAGREGLAAVTRKLAESHGLPWCLLLRGQPADDLVMGRLPDAAAAELLSHISAADLVIAVAQHIAENLRRRHSMRDVIWIPNAIDRDAFRPLQRATASRVTLDLAPDRTIILLPGSLSRRKRPMDVLKAAQIVIRHRPDALFLLAGTGPLEDELIAYSNSQGLGDHVRFLGQIPHDHMPALFGVADAVVMASDSEGLSRVYLEALACGRPLLASDIAASREIVADGQNGLLFPVGQPKALAARLLLLLEDAILRKRIEAAARPSISSRCLRRSVEMYVQALERLVFRQ